MRSRSTLIRTAFVLCGLAALALGGCSDDPSAIIDGNQSDPLNLTELSPAVSAQLDSAITLFSRGLGAATLQDGDHLEDDLADVLFVTGTVDSSSQSDGWLVYFFTDISTGAGTTVTVVTDSIQFRRGGSAVDDPRFADALTYRHKYESAYNDLGATYANIALRGDLVYTNIDDEAATINGSLIVDATNYETINEVVHSDNWRVEADLIGIGISKASGAWKIGCPESGAVRMDVAHLIFDGDVEQVEEWDVLVTFIDGSYTAVVTQSGAEALYSDQACNY